MIDEDVLASFSNRDALSFWSQEKIRFQDLDVNGHVNNVAYLAYVEGARLEMRRAILERYDDFEFGAWVIASTAIKFLKPTLYPGLIDVGVAPFHAGRTSFTLGYGLFQGSDCVAVAGSRSVQIDGHTKSPKPLPADFLQVMKSV